MMNVRKNPKIVITGGPGGGKTTALDLFRRELDCDAFVVPESATTLFSSGIQRGSETDVVRAIQKAIFRLQHDVEDIIEHQNPGKLLLCDRGTIDGLAYWPDSEESFFAHMNSTFEKEIDRYHAVIFFETAAASGRDISSNNPYRNESAKKACELDKKLQSYWSRHPHYHVVPSSESFVDKIMKGLTSIQKVVSNFK